MSTKHVCVMLMMAWFAVACGAVSAPPASAPAATVNSDPTDLPLATATVPAVNAAPSPTTGSPASLPAAAGIQVPAGLRATVFAQGLNLPTSLVFGPDGRLYVGQQDGTVLAIQDQGGSGSSPDQVARVGNGLLGIAFRPASGDLYLSTTGRVLMAQRGQGGVYSTPRVLVDNLPTGRHQNDEIAFSPDGAFFYLGVGSTCDACVEQDPQSASIMRFRADGTAAQVYAHGLRNPFGLATHPQTGELFATDNGRDAPVTGVPDEVNVIVEGGRYGWPDCWGIGKGTNCQGTIAPIVELQEHSSADGIAFYTGTSFPASYRGNLFVAEWGANVPLPGIGKRVERIALDQVAGKWQGTASVFATGFDHPLALAVNPSDGSLFVADHGTGIIYRIAAAGP